MLARSLLVVGLLSLPARAADEPKPLGPVEARKQVGKEITVELEVKARRYIESSSCAISGRE